MGRRIAIGASLRGFTRRIEVGQGANPMYAFASGDQLVMTQAGFGYGFRPRHLQRAGFAKGGDRSRQQGQPMIEQNAGAGQFGQRAQRTQQFVIGFLQSREQLVPRQFSRVGNGAGFQFHHQIALFIAFFTDPGGKHGIQFLFGSRFVLRIEAALPNEGVVGDPHQHIEQLLSAQLRNRYDIVDGQLAVFSDQAGQQHLVQVQAGVNDMLAACVLVRE